MAATQLSARYSQDVRFESGGFVSQTNPPALEGTGVSLLGGLPITYVRVGLRCGLSVFPSLLLRLDWTGLHLVPHAGSPYIV